jgi:hypothetical protein
MGLGIVWLLFDMPIDIVVLLGLTLGYIYAFFNFRFSYINKIWIENDILNLESKNAFLQSRKDQFEMEKLSNVKIFYKKWYTDFGRIEFNIDDNHKSYIFFKSDEQMVLQQQLKE